MAKQNYDLSLIGFGNVGTAFARLLLEKADLLAQDYGFSFRVTGIRTRSRGTAIDPDGIDLAAALALVENGGSLEELDKTAFTGSTADFIAQCPADLLVENSALSPQDGLPALDHIRQAMQAGKHAITANKGPVVFGYQELMALAKAQGKFFMFESAVMDGAPIFSLFRGAHAPLAGAKLLGFDGILNSCTNLLLELMEGGKRFEEAVAIAKSLGLTEADPYFDVDGWDASIKVAALATVLMGKPMTPMEVEREGIRNISPAMIEEAKQAGERWKLVCTAEETDGVLRTRVKPERVGKDSPFYSVGGASSIVRFKLDVLPALGILETDPSPKTTAYGLLHDLIFIAQAEAA